MFVFRLGLFPLTGGYTGGTFPGFRLDFVLDILHHSILPGLSIVLVAIGGWALLTRALVVTTLEEDFMVLARAKGLRGRTIFLRYALRNVLLPQVTALGLSLGQIVSGGVLVEQVFGYPGIGRLLTLSIRNSDFNLLGGVVFIIVVGVSLATLILDLTYPMLDPRVPYRPPRNVAAASLRRTVLSSRPKSLPTSSSPGAQHASVYANR